MKKPRELAGQAKLISEAALISHMQRFRDSDSALFYDGARLLAVYDYHRPMAPPPDGQPLMARNDKARWGRHTALYVPQLSPEWNADIAARVSQETGVPALAGAPETSS